MKINLQLSGFKKAVALLSITACAVGSGIAAYQYDKSETTITAKTAEQAGTVIYENSFASQADFDKCVVVQGPGNPAADKWKFYSYGNYATYSIYATDNADADCYLFFPIDGFDASKKYQITIDALTTTGSGNSYESTIEFGYASDATIDAYKAVNSTAIAFSNSDYSSYSSDAFTPAEGTKYAAIRAKFEFPELLKGSLETHVKKITVTESEGGNGDDDDPSGDTATEVLTFDLTTVAAFNTFTILSGEGNPSGDKWKFYSYGPYVTYSIYQMDAANANCYMFIPTDALDASKNYQLSIDAYTTTGSGNRYESAVEFGYAADATEAAYTAVNPQTIAFGNAFETYTSEKFTVKDGTKYLAIRVVYDFPALAKGSIETRISKVTLLEVSAGNSGDNGDDDDPTVETGKDIYTSNLETNTEFNTYTVLSGEGNPSDDKWKYNAPKWGDDLTKYLNYSIYKSDNANANCYMFIPVEALDASKNYQISVDAFTTTGSGNDYESAIEFGFAGDVTETAYTAVNSQTIAFGKAYTPYTSEKFAVTDGAKYIVIRAVYDFPSYAVGAIETRISKIVVTEFAGSGNIGGDDDDDEGGKGLALPYSIVPTEAQLDSLAMLDNNGDEFDRGNFQLGVWNYDTKTEALVYYYSNTDNADDYVFLPLLYFDNADNAYEVALDVMVASSNNPESFEICMGKTMNPDDLRVVYNSGNVVNDEDWETVTVPVGIEKKGDYYVAIHATSTKNGFKLYVKNISVTKLETSSNVPQAPAAITATAGEKGALTAEIAFTMPSLSVAGRELTGDVTVTVSSMADTKTVTAAAGAEVKTQLTTLQGDNIITLAAENSHGKGNSTTVTVYTGVDVPFAPELTAKVSEDNLTLSISWEQSETGLNGGYVDPATVNYTIYRYDSAVNDYDDGTVITGKTGYEFTCEAGAPQHRESFLITARNAAGQQEGANSISGVIGAPYALPMVETLPKGKLTYSPLTVEAPDASYSSSADFRVYNLATIFETPDPYYQDIMDGHSSAIWGFIRYGNAGKCRFLFPKFSTEDVKETKFKLNVFINEIFPTVDVYASAYETAPVKIGSISTDDGDGWTAMTFRIPESLAGQKWVQLYLDTEITDIDNQNVFISDYSLSNLLESDMALESLTGTDQALSIGDVETYTATVRNEGKTAAVAPSVVFTLTAENGDVIATETVTSDTTLAPEETAEYSFAVTASADNMGTYTLTAEIAQEDENNANNSASIDVNIIRGLKPVVNDLDAVANVDAATVSLTWSKPDIKLTGLDDFEDYAPFEYGNYIGNFKNVDLDGKKTYSYDQCVFDAATLPKAFMVINPDYLNNRLVVENYAPHSGKQYLVAFCPADGSKANDWLISPEVKPSTVISFYITTVAPSDYSEEYEVCYSSTTNDPAAFKVLAKKSVSGTKWVGEAYMLPDDAKYFAIHYVSADVFGIMLDDIDFTPVINERSIFTYNVYADGELIGCDIDKTEYVATGVTVFNSRYNVTAVVDGKEYAPSNTAVPRIVSGIADAATDGRSITVDGNTVVISGYAGEAAAVYSVDGISVYSVAAAGEVTEVTLPKGIYVVKAGNDVCKIAVK